MNLADRVKGWREAAPRFLERQAKSASQVRFGWDHPKRTSFVFGCQRSGTKMLMRILDNSPETRIYHENHASAFRDFQLRSDAASARAGVQADLRQPARGRAPGGVSPRPGLVDLPAL